MNSTRISSLYFTRDVIHEVLPQIHGDTVDLGAGLSRYKKMITERTKTFKTMDIQKFPGIDVVGDMLALPFPDASFDTALSMQVLEHVREPWTAVSEMARILRPGGTAIVSVPFVYPFHSDPHDYFRYSEEGLKSLFERSGLKIILCGKYGGWWAVQGETFKQRFVSPYKKPHPRWKRRLMSVVEWICSALNRMAPPGIVYANVICVAQKPA